MADSDNTTSLPFVIYLRKDQDSRDLNGDPPKSDPVIVRSRAWRTAYLEFLDLCERQQKLETDLCQQTPKGNTVTPPGSDGQSLSVSIDHEYAAARDAEERAAQYAEQLLRQVFEVPAASIAGVIAKLEVILLESEICDGAAEFPWPFIRSALDDLRSCAPPPATPLQTTS